MRIALYPPPSHLFLVYLLNRCNPFARHPQQRKVAPRCRVAERTAVFFSEIGRPHIRELDGFVYLVVTRWETDLWLECIALAENPVSSHAFRGVVEGLLDGCCRVAFPTRVGPEISHDCMHRTTKRRPFQEADREQQFELEMNASQERR